MNDFETTIGRWWVASRPTEVAAGYLDLDQATPGGPFRLTVDGKLADPPGPGVERNMTVHGQTPLGPFTILRASPTRWSRHSPGSPMQIWHGWQLIRGGHALADETFAHAQFQLPHLWDWISPTELNYHTMGTRAPRPTPDEPGDVLTAVLSDGVEVTLGRGFNEMTGRAGESWEGYGSYAVRRDEGVTLERLGEIVLALSRLHAVLCATPMEAYALSLRHDLGAESRELRIVDAAPPEGEAWGQRGLPDPFFDTSEVDFGAFIRSWLDLHSSATGAVAAAAPRDDRSFVTSKIVELCNGAEELAGLKWGSPESSAEDRAILDRLKEAGLRRDLRVLVGNTLRDRRWTLARKLESLAGLAGADSAEWLLGPSIGEWSKLVARLRNSIAHGSVLPGGLSDDVEFLIAAELSIAAVLRIALLRVAGYENPMSAAPGELLWSNGKRTVGHPNSDLFHHFTTVASYSAHWRTWLDRLT